jgi:large subunit ribosomal protein L5
MHPFVERYHTQAIPQLQSKGEYVSSYQIPRITQVTVNMGVGDYMNDGKELEQATRMLSLLTGQKPMTTKARKAIAGFKIRIGMPVGLKVTLRGQRMHDFLMKLIEIGLPRTRDFRGLKLSALTADGNVNIGIRDSIIFPDLPIDTKSYSLQVNIRTTARSVEETRTLCESLGFYFQSEEEAAEQRKLTTSSKTRKR